MKLPSSFPRYRELAKRYLADGRLPLLLSAVSLKGVRQGGRLGSTRDDLALLGRLAAAWWRGEYRGISRQALLAVVAALIYFVSPLDAVPDWLFAVGFLDDIAVLAWVMKTWRGELDVFRGWLERRSADQLKQLEVLPADPAGS
ncbi:YkvA family protein [Pseudomonas mangrovi]|uniref:DUF1232 domain-containing protein n=1 Tax=Pseudomonas mangrovi TaxID=2161748 RepID=A0A2T5PD81_9PSED|nr:YkvA family protein [Pseudomonas mangrovi]PTU75692.1 hypothetical protein DBO85_03190 [Pseudomonas mangrovi]